jgi:hypothetical protein
MNQSINKRPSATAYVLLHILAGPLIVDLTIVVLSVVSALPDRSVNWQLPHADIGEFVLLLGGLFVFSYVLGLVPAVLHALTMIVLHRRLGTSLLWLALTPVVGWLSTMLLIMLFSGISLHALAEAAPMGLLGSVAAIGCLAIACLRRIPPVRGKLSEQTDDLFHRH